MEVDDIVICVRCNTNILRKCQAIHMIACKSSQNQQPKQKKSFFQKLFGSEQQEQDQCMIPCTQCGQTFPFNVYSDHMKQCVGHQLTKCQQCKILFPTFLFQQHLQICQGQKVQFAQQEYYAQNNPLHVLISQLAQEELNFKQLGDDPLLQEQISKLKIIKTNKQQDCSICCCSMKQTNYHIQLNCKHFFHKSCISSWLKKNPRCPMCRTHALKNK